MSNKCIPRKKRKKLGSPLTLHERIIIELRYGDGKTVTEIAKELSRNKGTVSREIGGKPRKGRGAYNAERADDRASVRIKKRGNTSHIDRNERLRKYIVAKLKLGWSPEQISIRLLIEFKDDETMRISYEAIYQYVYEQIHRGGNGKVKPGRVDLRPHLARRHTRRAKKGFRKAQKVERKARLPSIEDRPPVVDTRSRIGDWEDDSIVSRDCRSRIKSINERRSGIFFFGKATDGTAQAGDVVVKTRLSVVPKKYRKTLTRDRGSENMGHEALEKVLDIDCFFAHAYSSYERGSNENGNGLFRRFFPKKTNWDTVSNEAIARAEFLINSRPRKRLGGRTPYEVFYQETGVALNP